MAKIPGFKEFMNKDTGVVSIPEILHFKMGQKDLYKRTPEGHIIIDEPIHFKHSNSKPKLVESVEQHTHLDTDHKNVPKNVPDHHVDKSEFYDTHHDVLSRHLTSQSKLNDDDKITVAHYTGHDNDKNIPNSRELNRSLAKGEKPSRADERIHNTIMGNLHKAGKTVHLYSGSRHDFSEFAKKSKDGILHSPAHISASHSHRVAADFAKLSNGESPTLNKDNNEYENHHPVHLNHIVVKPKDKLLHVSHISDFPWEHESIVPAGTKLKYSHTSKHQDGMHKNVHVHHFTIHSQE